MSRWARVLALATAGVLGLLALLHLYWVFGGHWGMEAAGPGGRALPPLPTMAAQVVLLLLGAYVLLCQAGVLPRPLEAWLYTWATFLVATALLLRAVGDFRSMGLFKPAADTAFARLDTLVYSPLSLVLGLVCALVGLAALRAGKGS